MKCINCGNTTDDGKVVCQNCRSTDRCGSFLRIHTCGSFLQMESKGKGVCQNVLLCAPIKEALKSKALIEPNLGHVVCPHPNENLRYVLYGKFSNEELKNNYAEILE